MKAKKGGREGGKASFVWLGILDYPGRRTVFLDRSDILSRKKERVGRRACTRSSLILGASEAPGRQHDAAKRRGSFSDVGINCKLVYRPQRALGCWFIRRVASSLLRIPLLTSLRPVSFRQPVSAHLVSFSVPFSVLFNSGSPVSSRSKRHSERL